MSRGTVIIDSGSATRQLVKNIRKQDANILLILIAANSMDEYNKPDLSHTINQSQRVDNLTRQSAGEFTEQLNLRLLPHTWVADVDADANVVKNQDQQWQYDKLVLVTSASAFVPPVTGRELMLILDNQQEYRVCETQLHGAQRVLIVGGGLIDNELTMGFCRASKAITLIDNAANILASLMSPEVSSRLQHRLTDIGAHLLLKSQPQDLEKTASGIRATLDHSRSVEIDTVIATTGLRPETTLARYAGLNINRGVCIGGYLQTSHPDIHALGDCVEINDQALSFLQSIQLGAMYPTKDLFGNNTPLKLPAMLAKVRTPELSLHLIGEIQRRDLNWHITAETQGVIAKGMNNEGQLCAFIVSEDHMREAFALLKTLPV